MNRTSRMIDRRLATVLVLLQASMIPVAALLAWGIQNATAALSAALGAFVSSIETSHAQHVPRNAR